MPLLNSLSSVKALDYTIDNVENTSETTDNPTVLVGGHDATTVDTGTVLGEEDAARNSAVIDIDVDSAPRETREPAPIHVHALPEDSFDFLPSPIGGQPLLDADILSGSYGATYLIAAEVGPDGIGHVATVGAPLEGDEPVEITVLDTSVGDFFV
jgi:hypothetical protein